MAGHFTTDGYYRITSRENADAGLPIGLVYCMARHADRRIRAVMNDDARAPLLRHYNSNARVLDVMRRVAPAQLSGGADLDRGRDAYFAAGRYDDTFVREDGRLLLKARDCIYDTLNITNALIYPV